MTRHPALTILMALVGIILLLPGVCAAVFIVGGMARNMDSFLASLWAVCFLISAGGVFLLYLAFRKPPAPQP